MAAGELTDADVFGAPAPTAGPAAAIAAPMAATSPVDASPNAMGTNSGVVPAGGTGAQQPIAFAPLTAPSQAALKEMSDADVFGPDSLGQDRKQNLDDTLGMIVGAEKPLDNAAHWLNNVVNLDGVAKAVGLPTTAEAIAQHKGQVTDAAAHGFVPSQRGQFVGGMIGTAPVAMLPGGAILQGAAAGALDSDNPDDAASVGQNALIGGILGKAGHVVSSGILSTLAPKITPSAQVLLKSGVPLTTDMMTGGKGPWGVLGKVASMAPGAGELYRAAGNDALAAASPGFANAAMAPINPAIGPVENGSGLYDAAKGAINTAYDSVAKGATVPLTGAYAAQMAPVQATVAGLPADLQRRFSSVVSREIVGRIDPTTGSLTDQGVKDAKVGINKEISKFPTPSGWESDYVDALKDTRRAVTDALGATSPAAQVQLQAADAAYPGYKTVQASVRRANLNSTTQDAFPVPQQMLSAVRENSSPDAFAAGTAPGQAYAQAAKDILPRKFKDVASLGHAFMEGGIGAGVIGSDVLGHAGLPLMAAQASMIPLYTKPVQSALRRGLIGTAGWRAALEAKIGPLERYFATPSALTGGLVAPQAAALLNANMGPQQGLLAQ